MSIGSADEVSKELRSLQAASPGISAAFLSGVDGKILGSTAITGMEKVQLSAISAASLAIAKKATGNLQLGELKQVHIEGDTGSVVLLTVGTEAILSLVVGKQTALEPVLMEARKTRQRFHGAG